MHARPITKTPAGGRHRSTTTGRWRSAFALLLLLPTWRSSAHRPRRLRQAPTSVRASKVEIRGETKTVTYTAPAGYLVSGWCVKAGTTIEVHEVDPPTATVTITHSSGKGVSHYSVVLVKAPEPKMPTAPTSSDVCEPATGPTNDRITIPTDANFTYTLDGAAVAAGQVVATGTTHTVMAVAKAGVVVKDGAMTKWTFTFTKVLCVTPPPPPPPPVAPAAATSSDVCEPATGPTNDRITIPTDANFTYTVDGVAVAAGQVVATGTTHVVMAVPKTGVVVKEGATTKWTFTFTKVACVTPPPPPPPAAGHPAGHPAGHAAGRDTPAGRPSGRDTARRGAARGAARGGFRQGRRLGEGHLPGHGARTARQPLR